MSLAEIRERMEREFARLRGDLKRIEELVVALRRDVERLRDARARLDRARRLLREVEWRQESRTGARAHTTRCPVCGGAQPEHASDCDLAAALAALGG